jgi:glycosyltransferase involved in cell wall biosynthesis
MTGLPVSVVIPVRNAAGHPEECPESPTARTIGSDRIEVVAVNDGSTDTSGGLPDAWAARHPDVRVFHRPGSGTPGGPRNRAIDAATGEFLFFTDFFADPDDHLGPESFERMLAAAGGRHHDVPVRFPNGYVPAEAGTRRLLMHGTRPMTVRLHHDPADGAVLTAAHGRDVAGAVGRRFRGRP